MNVFVVNSEVAATILQTLCLPDVEVCYIGQRIDTKRIRRLYILMPATSISALAINDIIAEARPRMTEDAETRVILI